MEKWLSNIKYSAVDNLEALLVAKRYNDFLINEIVKNSNGMRSALDFGSGIGTFPLALRDKGFEVVCVEPDRNLCQQLKDYGFKAYFDIKDVPLKSREYIYSLNVLEHIENDSEILHLLSECLKPEGLLFLYVPAFNILYSSMDRKVGHLRRYKKGSLCELIKTAGLKIDRAEYVDSLGFLVSLIYKVIGNKRGDLNLTFVKIFDGFIFPISRIFDRILKHIFGKNLLVVARR